MQKHHPMPLVLNTAQPMPARNKAAHKGDFGHVLVIGGNHGMGGAVRLAAEAAARVGAGLVSVATQAAHVAAFIAARPEVMCHGVALNENLAPLLARATVLLLGAGLGQDAWAQHLYAQTLASDLPKIIDADALNLLAKNPVHQHNWILTPHPGEAARLLGCSTQAIQADRQAAAQQLQKRYGGIIVLKGAGTLVQGVESDSAHICTAGNPGMASGGMGDVLGGVIAGLLAQGLSLEEAAKTGVLIHALAADRAAAKAGERGLLALDLMVYLREVLNGSTKCVCIRT